MGKCKNCNVKIPNDQILCDNCKAEESYLDDLLSSVVSTQSEDGNDSKKTSKRKLKKKTDKKLEINSETKGHNIVNQDNSESEGQKHMEKEEGKEVDLKQINMDQFEEGLLDDTKEGEPYEMNDIFEFMDAVGNDSESVEWSNKEDEPIDETSNEKNPTSAGNLNNDLGMNADNVSVLDNVIESNNLDNSDGSSGDVSENDNKDTDDNLSLEDDVLAEGSEDINELLDYLTNDDNAATSEEPLPEISSVNTDDDMELGSTIEDVFSDTLKAVDNLEDPMSDDLSSVVVPEVSEDELAKKAKEKEKKRNIFKELMFGSEDEDLESEEGKEEKKKEKKAKKEKKSKKKLKAASDHDESDKKKRKEKKVKPVKPKKEKKKEEEEIDLGVINKYATAIIFLVFAIIAITVISGTEILAYSDSVKAATTEFERQRYDYAYNALRGTDIKEKDSKLYDQVMTVMLVNTHLNSYRNFYSTGDYPRALDSLLKGLKRYDKYIESGKKLGIESDLNYVKSQILSELKSSYQLSEKDALDIINSKNQTTYSKKIYAITDKNITMAEKE